MGVKLSYTFTPVYRKTRASAHVTIRSVSTCSKPRTLYPVERHSAPLEAPRAPYDRHRTATVDSYRSIRSHHASAKAFFFTCRRSPRLQTPPRVLRVYSAWSAVTTKA